MRSFRPLLLCLSFALAPSLSLGQTTVTGVVSEMPSSLYMDSPAYSESELLVPELNFVPYSIDFNALGDIEITFVWKAPAGQHIQVAAPAGYTTAEIEFFYNLDASTSGAIIYDLASMGFRNHTGGLPDDGIFDALFFSAGSPPGARVYARIPFTPGETATFESFEVTITIPASSTLTYSNVPVLQFGMKGIAQEVITYVGVGALYDPGNWVSLVPAPNDGGAAARKASLKRKAKRLKRQLSKAKRQKNRRKIAAAAKKLRKVNRDIKRVVIPPGPTPYLKVDQLTF